MTLPNFLVIGAQRSGTTWLDRKLRTHPNIYLPDRRKEVHFFDKYYDRRLEWYQGFFPSPELAGDYSAIGEISPMYLFDLAAPARIHECLPDCKLIAILRNPAERAYSQYRLWVSSNGERRDFLTVLQNHPGIFERGLYSVQIGRYLEFFSLSDIHVIIFENIHDDPQSALNEISGFLSVDPDLFDSREMGWRMDTTHRPGFPRALAIAKRLGNSLRASDLDWVIDSAKKLGARSWFGNRGKLPGLDQDIKEMLLARYEADINSLEAMLEIDLSFWRDSGF